MEVKKFTFKESEESHLLPDGWIPFQVDWDSERGIVHIWAQRPIKSLNFYEWQKVESTRETATA